MYTKLLQKNAEQPAKYFDVVGKKLMSVWVVVVVITGAKVKIIFKTTKKGPVNRSMWNNRLIHKKRMRQFRA
jgi:hypothetical protein